MFAELFANKTCGWMMECRHHLKMISVAVERLTLALQHSSMNSKLFNVQHLTGTLGDCSLCVNAVLGCLLGCQMKKQDTQRSSACQGVTGEAKGRLDS